MQLLETQVEAIAKMCHQANKVWNEINNEYDQVSWDIAPVWQKKSCIEGVIWRLENWNAPVSAQHEAWSKSKVEDGWVFGLVKDAEKKTHPCLVPFEELPQFQRIKDNLFTAIVMGMAVGMGFVPNLDIELDKISRAADKMVEGGPINWQGEIPLSKESFGGC